MYILSIAIENFRSYKDLFLEVDPYINVFYGQNAQGKTNILEAIYLLSCARSHRTAKDKDLIYHDFNGQTQNNYKIDLQVVYHQNKSSKLSLLYQENLFSKEDFSDLLATSIADSPKEGYVTMLHKQKNRSISKRVAFEDDVPFEKLKDFIGLFNAVIFAPEDLALIKEGPSVRRRFLDILISQVKPSYFYDLTVYNRLLMQRNKTLKNLRSHSSIHLLTEMEKAEIGIWDHLLAEIGSRIIANRLYYINKLTILAKEKHHFISNQKENLQLKYKTVVGILDKSIIQEPFNSVKKIEMNLLVKWESLYQEDYEKGTTSIGIQRDDIDIFLNKESMRPFSSQGQQRSAVLALKLAEFNVLREENRTDPILLLDDVFSELDENRRASLLNSIGDAQVFITCTDKNFIKKELLSLDKMSENKLSFFKVDNSFITKDG